MTWHWLFLGPDPQEDELVVDEAYQDAFTEGLVLHKNAGIKQCPSLKEKSNPCETCRQAFGDDYFMWRMRVKLNREQAMSAMGTPLKNFGHAAGQMARRDPHAFKSSFTRQDPYEDSSPPA